jgi:hypothetical protein
VPANSSNSLEQYLAAMRTAHSFGAHVAETTFYTPLANLFNAVGQDLKPRVVFVATLASRGAGIPDGGLFPVAKKSQTAPFPNQRPERGVVEIKPPGDSLANLAQSAQVLRYLKEYGLCLITNYHQFQLVCLDRNNQPSVMESYDLTLTANDLWHAPLTELARRHAETLPDFLARVFERRVPLIKPKDVASLLASYAREARERAADHPLAAFAGVKSALQESLGITFEGEKGEHFFLSTLIQTLFYGIFSAWILWRRSPDYRAHNFIFNWRLSADYLRLAVLRTLFHAIAEPGALQTVQITEVLDHATDALNRVQPDFFTTFREEDAVQYFYEPFLEAFDPQLRKDLGVWYTPREIVRYMVERVDHLLRTEVNEPLGLASPNVQVLDPCCGTGAYLIEVLHRIERTLREQAGDDDALVGADLRRAVTTRIFGFEIMPAPFVISHLQIAQFLEDKKASLAASQRAQVFLTNALTGWVPVRHPQSTFGYAAFTAERDAAEAVKQADTILVILGNPPYNGYAGIAQVEEERGLTTAYRTPVQGLAAPQGQGLNDLYVRFFRIAERRIIGDASARGNVAGRGLVSFISNNAWLDGLSHVSMRSRYLREFQSIYIDNLNGDKYRTGKTTPEGLPDPSAFSTPQNREGIQVGTAISTFVRTSPSSPLSEGAPSSPLFVIPEGNLRLEMPGPPPPFTIHLRNLWGTHKLSHLDREARRELSPAYDPLAPTAALGLPFADRIHTATYPTWPRLPELFPTSFSGVKTARDSFLVDIDREPLIKRVARYYDRRESDSEIEHSYPIIMKDVPRYNAKEIRKELIDYREAEIALARESGIDLPLDEHLRNLAQADSQRYYYRPFDLRWLYYEHNTKLLDERREEYWGAHKSVPAMISAQANRRSYDPPAITRSLASYHVIERASLILPISYKADTAPGLTEDLRNLSESVLRNGPLQANPDHYFFHALATMHTPQYRLENSGALLGDWPRIPLPATAELLSHSATLGRRLADLLDPESDLNLAAEWSFLARLSIAAEFPEGTPDRDARNAARFALTAGWGGAGQGATVMPRRGDYRERDWTPTEIARLSTLLKSPGGPSIAPALGAMGGEQSLPEPLTLEAALNLLGHRCVDVYLNGTSHWTAIPINVWNYTLGGYQVLKKWLSYRELPLLHRPLHEDEARYFAQVVRRITAILLMGPALDASYAAILPTATGLPLN